ncbi:HVO_A0556 family zinc finger protein [Natronorubrum halalkaliphilum]|uniref:HVO_A0556 family zinc finger protein n=1 Tax=Natronorubrum halalkaliphilum TaxID=2691917 RepID=UPI001916040E|nr:HVO_A0556 family zinc finger protein [Natronorubrum halalkaliphilum]
MAKSQSSQTSGGDRQLLALLEGRSCSYCPDGELERDVYKDNQAVVCDSCDTPHAQLW